MNKLCYNNGGDKMKKIICIGHATYDITIPIEAYPLENTKTRYDIYYECGGGPAATAAYLLGKWQQDISFIGTLGDDYNGQKILAEFQSVGVKTTLIDINSSIKTTFSYILANKSNGKRTVISVKDKNLKYSKDYLVTDADVILVDGTDHQIALQTIINNPNAIKIIDAGRNTEEVIKLAKQTNYLICSKEFAKNYTNINIDNNDLSLLKKAYDILAKSFHNKIAITLEAAGVFTKDNDEYYQIEGIKVKSIDSTGAGDIFHGAFTYFIANNYDFITALKYANITAGLSVTKIGTRNSIFELSEVLNYDYK